MTLTTRLSVFFLVALAVVLAGFSTALYLVADVYLNRQLDERLDTAARMLAAAAEVEPDGVEWEPGNRTLNLGPMGFGDQVFWSIAADARLIDRSPQPGTESLLAEADRAIRAGHRDPRRLDHDGRAWKVTQLRLAPETLPGPVKAGKHAALTLTLAVPLDPVLVTLRELAAALAGLTLLVLLAALISGRWVCRRALAPVSGMAAAARAMGAADLADRLPVPPTRDELADLGVAFNGLLDRLAEAFERERRFAGEASHQLRTPLAGIIGQMEVALRRDRAAGDYRRALETVLAQAGRLQRVVEALLFLARSEAEAALPGLERTDLAAWIPRRVTEWAKHPRAADLAPEASGEAVAAIHPDLFGELLDALLDNALKYSPPGTPVTVRVGRDEETVFVEVVDRGWGMAPDEVPHLFRPFFRSEAARRRGVAGSGLGLAVAARIAAALGGSISVQSDPGTGTRFRVRLPPA